MKKNIYCVTVGNVGNMEYTSKKLALECFNTYVTLSKNNEGRAAGESVYLFKNGEIVSEYIGTIDQEEQEEELHAFYGHGAIAVDNSDFKEVD